MKIVTNAGGMNPKSCAEAAATNPCAKPDLGDVMIGVVSGDDLLPRIAELQAAGCEFKNLDDGRPLSELKQPIVSANAYLGAQPIAEALGRERGS
ncbi:MAG: acyclic terpene utilization AtuA family protein [Pirellulales bacterium]